MRHLKTILIAAFLAGSAQPLLAQRGSPELLIRVVDQQTGAPVPSARIEISGKRSAGLTTTAGELKVAGLEPRQHLVSVERVGYTYYQFIADMTPGGTLAVDVELVPLPGGDRSVPGSRGRAAPLQREPVAVRIGVHLDAAGAVGGPAPGPHPRSFLAAPSPDNGRGLRPHCYRERGLNRTCPM